MKDGQTDGQTNRLTTLCLCQSVLRDRTTLRVIEYFAKSLKVIQSDTVE